jgi:dihydropteroate synthase
VFNPLGLLTGDAAVRGIAARTAFPLAGGPVAFSMVETFKASAPGILSDYMPATEHSGAVATLSAARTPFADIDLSRPVVTVTPDSFSDGGDYADSAQAIDQAMRLAGEGAAIIDIGGESTRPGADPMPVGDEITRVIPVIEAAVAEGITVSVDTRRSTVMRAAIDAGARIVNDISALMDDTHALGVVAETGASVVLMHMQGRPDTMQQAPLYRLASYDIFEWLSARIDACVAAGIPHDRIAVDPGIGFGKTDDHNMEILQRAGAFHSTGCAVAVGVSRKSFIGRIAGVENPKDRLPGTIVATMLALSRGVQIHRVHDVAAAVQAIAIWNAHVGEVS